MGENLPNLVTLFVADLIGLFSGVDALVVDPLLLCEEELFAVLTLLPLVAQVRTLMLQNIDKKKNHQKKNH
jgi:hypothetical protein